MSRESESGVGWCDLAWGHFQAYNGMCEPVYLCVIWWPWFANGSEYLRVAYGWRRRGMASTHTHMQAPSQPFQVSDVSLSPFIWPLHTFSSALSSPSFHLSLSRLPVSSQPSESTDRQVEKISKWARIPVHNKALTNTDLWDITDRDQLTIELLPGFKCSVTYTVHGTYKLGFLFLKSLNGKKQFKQTKKTMNISWKEE